MLIINHVRQEEKNFMAKFGISYLWWGHCNFYILQLPRCTDLNAHLGRQTSRLSMVTYGYFVLLKLPTFTNSCWPSIEKRFHHRNLFSLKHWFCCSAVDWDRRHWEDYIGRDGRVFRIFSHRPKKAQGQSALIEFHVLMPFVPWLKVFWSQCQLPCKSSIFCRMFLYTITQQYLGYIMLHIWIKFVEVFRCGAWWSMFPSMFPFWDPCWARGWSGDCDAWGSWSRGSWRRGGHRRRSAGRPCRWSGGRCWSHGVEEPSFKSCGQPKTVRSFFEGNHVPRHRRCTGTHQNPSPLRRIEKPKLRMWWSIRAPGGIATRNPKTALAVAERFVHPARCWQRNSRNLGPGEVLDGEGNRACYAQESCHASTIQPTFTI